MPAPGDLLSPDQLNRALLARQHLLERHPGPAIDVVGHLVGQQAQNAWSPYVGLWSRVEGFRHAELGDAFWDRTVARIAVMRGTIHLVTRADALLLPGVTAPIYARDLLRNAVHGPALRGVDVPAVTAAARALVEAEPRVTTDLGRLLAQTWPDVPPGSLAYAARGTLPLVQVPPRGVWGRSGATTWTTADAWFGEPSVVPDADALGTVVLRYLAAFGPASVADVQSWSGLGGLRSVVDDLGDRVVRYRAAPAPGGVRTRELLDVPDGLLPAPATPAPVRFLPDYDNVLLGHADRTRIISDAHRRLLGSPNGVVPATFLLDGRVAGTWAMSRTGPRTLTVRPFDAITRADRRSIEAEAQHLVRFMADDHDDHDVVIV